MSRRKQLHPKPCKPFSSEDGETEMSSEMDHRGVIDVPSSLVIRLQPVDSSPKCTVCNQVALVKGTSFGPYRQDFPAAGDHKIKRENDADKEEEEDEDGCAAGAWLSLLRTTSREEESNISISRKGNRLWCFVKRDLPVDTELVASLEHTQDGAGDVPVPGVDCSTVTSRRSSSAGSQEPAREGERTESDGEAARAGESGGLTPTEGAVARDLGQCRAAALTASLAPG
ncbi:PREDICTED: uncharacterized protein LOC106815663 [Priapulus caudatus]|uniref:Uncharacterized protein LOC106815663 n=1 Tax=Priapulus caudatus TaxID=37621 RepID=A0ABM1ETX5_PRICU|nr:PREDICTED: uncharacterized protein LOC106815663 [Priapulus caudatus]